MTISTPEDISIEDFIDEIIDEDFDPEWDAVISEMMEKSDRSGIPFDHLMGAYLGGVDAYDCY